MAGTAGHLKQKPPARIAPSGGYIAVSREPPEEQDTRMMNRVMYKYRADKYKIERN
jgi:hypothetical protein